MREYLFILAMVALPFSTAHSRVSCDLGDDRDSKTVIASPDFDFENGDLVAEDGFDDIMRITPRGDLYIHEEKIAVTNHQRKLLVAYYDNVEGITDEAVDLGIEAAKFGIRTAVSAIFMALSMDDDEADEFEKEVEAEAEQFEQFADRICDRVDELVQLEQELVREIPAFIPMIRQRRSLSI